MSARGLATFAAVLALLDLGGGVLVRTDSGAAFFLFPTTGESRASSPSFARASFSSSEASSSDSSSNSCSSSSSSSSSSPSPFQPEGAGSSRVGSGRRPKVARCATPSSSPATSIMASSSSSYSSSPSVSTKAAFLAAREGSLREGAGNCLRSGVLGSFFLERLGAALLL